MGDDLIGRSALMQSLRGNVLVEVTQNLEQAIKEQPAAYGADFRERLAEYEDLEGQGKLLRLPFAVGDTAYTINTLPSGKAVIGEIEADAFFCALCMLDGRFGKTVFLTREEAEAALKGGK